MNARLPDSVLARVQLPMLRLVHIHRLEPAFDCLPLVEVYRRRCALFRHEGRFIGVCEDTLAANLQHWVELRAGDVVEWYRVASLDLTDWLHKHAEVSPAMQKFLEQTHANAGIATLHEIACAA